MRLHECWRFQNPSFVELIYRRSNMMFYHRAIMPSSERTWRNMQEPSSDVAQAMHRLADEIHALRMELTPSLRKTEALQDQEAARKLRLINLKKKAAG